MQIPSLKPKRPNQPPCWAPSDLLRFSDGEIHFLWHFIQGSIMIPDTRRSLRRSWGLCDRHSFGFIAIETAYRHDYLHGQAVLYKDLMKRAAAALNAPAPLYAVNVAFKLRATGPCLMCKLEYGPTSKGAARPELIEQGRDLGPIRTFANDTAPYWRVRVCGRCAANDSRPRCRIHVREELISGSCDAPEQRALVQYIFEHVTRYARSFVWGHHGTDTVEDRGALIEAIGWLAGWRPWLALIGEPVAQIGNSES
jgi:hypothetical protein